MRRCVLKVLFFSLTLFLLSIFFFFSNFSPKVFADNCGQQCTQTSQCIPRDNGTATCSSECDSPLGYCVGGDNAHCSCSITYSDSCPPGEWGPWSACSADGLQIRWCSTNGDDSQFQPCDTDEGGGGGCTETVPSSLSTTTLPPTSAVLNWTPGANGSYQYLWVSVNPNPQVGCIGSTGGTSICPVKADLNTTPLPPDQISYTIDNLLTPGTVYYWRVVNIQSSDCYKSADSSFLSSCKLSSASLNMEVGQSVNFVTNVNSSSGINRVGYSTKTESPGGPYGCYSTWPEPLCNSKKGCIYGNGRCNKMWIHEKDAVSLNPLSDNSYVYQTTATGLSANSDTNKITTITSDVFLGSSLTPACTDTVNVTVTTPGPWWQVKDSDIQSRGDLTSAVPSVAGTFFGTAGPGGFPGVSSYGGTTNLTGANVSSKGWLADSPVTNSRVYNYAYFTNQIPSDILSIINNVNIVDVSGSLTTGGTHDTNNYYWYKYDGVMNANQPLTIPTTNIGTRKVILLVDNADVNITGNINLTDGQGFFMLIVRGGINVDSTVGGGASPNLEGMYFADTTFTDGVGNTRLTTRGSIVANGGISMLRDLDDNTPPSELFEYAPDQIILFPKIIGTRKMEWKEVAP